MNTRKQYALYHQQIQDLQHWQLTAISAAVTERSWTHYLLFSDLTDFGDAKEVRHCLNLLWDNIAGLQSAKNFERLLEKLENNTPDQNDFDMFGVEPALDFIVSLNCAVNCAMESSIDDVASALTLSFNTIGKYIKHAETPDLDDTELALYIEKHDLYLAHLNYVDDLINTLRNQKKQNKDFARSLQKTAENGGISSLGISLE